MKIKILETTPTLAVSVDDMKMFARIGHDDDNYLLEGLIKTATAWVEDATGKTLLEKKLIYTHSNNVVTLPGSPIIEVLNVKAGSKTLEPNQYEITDHQSTKKITVPTFYSRRHISITYRAGFGTTSADLPETLKQAVMSTVLYIYENRYDLTPKASVAQTMDPWIHYHRTYQMA